MELGIEATPNSVVGWTVDSVDSVGELSTKEHRSPWKIHATWWSSDAEKPGRSIDRLVWDVLDPPKASLEEA